MRWYWLALAALIFGSSCSGSDDPGGGDDDDGGDEGGGDDDPGPCADCSDDEYCDDGMCVACSCGDATCGVDQCGDSCGTCDDGQICNASRECEVCDTTCAGNCGYNECGESCGECSGEQVCIDSMCADFEPEGLTHDNAVDAPDESFARPAAGANYTDPIFGTTITRVTSRSGETYVIEGQTIVGGFEVADYSQIQAFNADQTLMLLVRDDPSYRVRRVSDLSVVQVFEVGDMTNAHWHPTRPSILLSYIPSGTDVRLQETDVNTGQSQPLATLDGYQRLCISQSNEELSHDGKWIAGLALREGESSNFTCGDAPALLNMYAYNLEERRFGAQINLQEDLIGGPCPDDEALVKPDWVAPSPLGNYLVVQWSLSGTDRCNGVETFDIETGEFIGRLGDHLNHGDLGLPPDWEERPENEREYYMTFELLPDLDGSNGDYFVAYSWLPGPASGRAEPQAFTNTNFVGGIPAHISCQGPDGMCLVSTYDAIDTRDVDPEFPWQPFETEVFIQSFDGSVHRLAHTRSNACGYRNQPHATWSRNGQYALFASDWFDDNSCDPPDEFIAGVGRADAYLVHVVE